MREWIVKGTEGARLDKYVMAQLDFNGLRGAKRFIQDGNVFLNGKPGKCGDKIKNGDRLTLAPQTHALSVGAILLAKNCDYGIFYKPEGMHTQTLAGRQNNTLENALSHIAEMQRPILLQRLDYGTSGLICAAFHDEARLKFRKAERACQCHKYYLAVLEGHLPKSLRMENPIDGSGKKRVKVLDGVEDPLYHTAIEPLWQGSCLDGIPITLARCAINAGKRHQIRAHAAYAGFPLIGDSLYGSSYGCNFALQHYAIDFLGCKYSHFVLNQPFKQFFSEKFINSHIGAMQCAL